MFWGPHVILTFNSNNNVYYTIDTGISRVKFYKSLYKQVIVHILNDRHYKLMIELYENVKDGHIFLLLTCVQLAIFMAGVNTRRLFLKPETTQVVEKTGASVCTIIGHFLFLTHTHSSNKQLLFTGSFNIMIKY